MIIPREYCPKCKTLRNIRITETHQEIDDNSKNKKIRTKSFHCETCQTFVRSEDSEEIK